MNSSPSVSSVPMVGCRNACSARYRAPAGVYQVFRWWGVGTRERECRCACASVSSVPMVGCRNTNPHQRGAGFECIKCSDGGVSEQQRNHRRAHRRVYQVFRWWGVGTRLRASWVTSMSVSSVPMVGCRNHGAHGRIDGLECIKCSDGGVSEPRRYARAASTGVYQVFRWWGVGTLQFQGS